MLVCNISQRPKAHAVAADLAEAAAADDTSTSGNVVFATLVDDPAATTETLDAYLGTIMLEAASAADTIDAGLVLGTGSTIAETTSAADVPDAAVVAGGTTWNPADKGTTNTILSNGNLTYGAGASNTTNDGCRGTNGLSTGKLYFELTAAGSTATVMLGVGTLSSLFNSILSGSGGAFAVYTTNSHIWNNNVDTTISIGTPIAGDVYCYAIDLVNMRGWIRKNGGNWNNSGTANPATNTGGQDISWLGTGVNVFPLVASNANANPIVTANFGATAFAQTIPSGFAAWG